MAAQTIPCRIAEITAVGQQTLGNLVSVGTTDGTILAQEVELKAGETVESKRVFGYYSCYQFRVMMQEIDYHYRYGATRQARITTFPHTDA